MESRKGGEGEEDKTRRGKRTWQERRWIKREEEGGIELVMMTMFYLSI